MAGEDEPDSDEDNLIKDFATPLYWVSVKVGLATSLRGGRQYKVHIARPGWPDQLGCSEKIESMIPVGREVSADGAVCKRCARLWPQHAETL